MDRKFINFIKLFLVLVILIFSLQSWTRADDISDFEIEGISIGDSLLDFVDKNYINSDKSYLYKNKKYYAVMIRKDFEKFDSIQVSIKDKDKKYIIHALAGKTYYRNNNINECYGLLNHIDLNVSETLKNIIIDKKVTGKKAHTYDKTGESTTDGIYYSLENENHLYIYCTDWSDKFDFTDNLKVQIRTSEYNNWLRTANE